MEGKVDKILRIIKPAQRKLLWFRSDKKYINRLYRIGVFDEGYDTSCNTVTVSHWTDMMFIKNISRNVYLFIRLASCTLKIIFFYPNVFVFLLNFESQILQVIDLGYKLIF